ncbi:MAG: hypothetical protein MK135_08980 [Polyangiaceae bacterium]|nr:hypothetical protein [Polyangiaceae bacterium]
MKDSLSPSEAPLYPSPVGHRRWLRRFFIATLCISSSYGAWQSAPASAKDKEEESDIDYIGLAARLIADNKIDRAQQMLDQVDLEAEDVDLIKFYTLRGMVMLKQGASLQAIENFELALKNGQEDPAIHLYLAQAHFSQKHYRKTIEHLKKAGPVAQQTPAAFGILAQAHWELDQKEEAFTALDGGIKKFPEDNSLLRVKIFYLVELELYQEVVRLSSDYLKSADIGEDEYIAIGEALRRGRQLKKARLILGQAKLRFPDSVKLPVQMAHTYVDEERPILAALLFEEASRKDPKYALEAAELYKEAGRPEVALSLNAQVIDQKDKLKQRLSLLLEAERFEMVTGMAPALSRIGLLSDDNVRYAVAYAFYKLGDFSQAEKELRIIKDPGLFRAATQLRKAMANCRDAGWECY